MPEGIDEVLAFWFAEGMQKHWFRSTAELDSRLRTRFEATWQAAVDGRLDAWQSTAEGCLALAIVLDQFPLNMYRGQAKAFRSEPIAIEVAKRAIVAGLDRELAPDKVAFLYMPLMHSESMADQDMAVRLFEQAGLDANLRFARHHRELICRFGRFPHRNAILGRTSTSDELAYLASKEAFTG